MKQSSDLLLSATARAPLCEKMTGARDTSSTWRMVAADTWARSTSMPSLFISCTTDTPNCDQWGHLTCQHWSCKQTIGEVFTIYANHPARPL